MIERAGTQEAQATGDVVPGLPEAYEAQASLATAHRLLATLLPEGTIDIYEAGGGSDSYLPASVLRRARVTVVDIDQRQLARNDYAVHKVQGDIQEHRFPENSFDLVVCYNVIEHLPDVEAALRRFHESLRPEGLVFIGAPNPASLTGAVTRYSPHWFHVAFYRYVRGYPNAGKPGEVPFPTHYHPLVSPKKLKAFAEQLGFEVVYLKIYESYHFAAMRSEKPWFATVMDGVTSVLNFCLLGRTNVRLGDYHVILRKRVST